MQLLPWMEAELQIWSGRKGGAKSYCATRAAIEWLELGHPVITDIVILQENYKTKKQWDLVQIHGDDFENYWYNTQTGEKTDRLYLKRDEDPDQLGWESRNKFLDVIQECEQRENDAIESGQRKSKRHILVVIDEAALRFNSHNYKTFPRGLLALLTQQRKLNISMIVIVQDVGMVDISFRRLCEKFVYHSNLARAAGVFGDFVGIFTPNLHFRFVRDSFAGKPGPKKHDRKLFVINKKYARCYRTTQRHDSEKVPAFTRRTNRGVRMFAWYVMLMIVMRVLTWMNGIEFSLTPKSWASTLPAAPGSPSSRPAGQRKPIEGILAGDWEENGVRFLSIETKKDEFLDLQIPAAVKIPGVLELGEKVSIPRDLVYRRDPAIKFWGLAGRPGN